ncbi:hypothetical protein BJ742DRAFT_846720 [Cladochytrium replicatum]|nr:hypothetical protein BJ742DRAFT_846720 [Cladochytrium replicatum]
MMHLPSLSPPTVSSPSTSPSTSPVVSPQQSHSNLLSSFMSAVKKRASNVSLTPQPSHKQQHLPDTPLLLEFLPLDGELDSNSVSTFVDGVAGAGQMVLKGRVRITNHYHHPIPVSFKSLEVTFKGDATICLPDRPYTRTTELINHTTKIIDPLNGDLPVKIMHPVTPRQSMDSRPSSPQQPDLGSSTAQEFYFLVELPESITSKLPPSACVPLRSYNLVVRYQIVAAVRGIDIYSDPTTPIESSPLPIVIERSYAPLLDHLSFYPNRVHEITDSYEKVQYHIRVPKVLLPGGRLDMSYHFTRLSKNPQTPPKPITRLFIDDHAPRRLELTVSETMTLFDQNGDELAVIKNSIRPLVLGYNRLTAKGWDGPCKVAIRLPVWSPLNREIPHTNVIKNPRSVEILNATHTPLSDSHPQILQSQDPATTLTASTYTISHTIDIAVVIIETFLVTRTHSIPITVLPSSKSSPSSHAFESLMRSLGGVGAQSFADMPPPENERSNTDPIEYEVLEYESILRARERNFEDDEGWAAVPPPEEGEERGKRALEVCKDLTPSYSLSAYLLREEAGRMAVAPPTVVEEDTRSSAGESVEDTEDRGSPQL